MKNKGAKISVGSVKLTYFCRPHHLQYSPSMVGWESDPPERWLIEIPVWHKMKPALSMVGYGSGPPKNNH